MTLEDAEGEAHEFRFRSRILGDGLVLEAVEFKAGEPRGYEFQVIGEGGEEALAVFGNLYQRMRRALARKHLVQTDLGPHVADDNLVRARIAWDPNRQGVPLLVIDGREMSWDDFGRMLQSYEGFQFKLQIFDRSEEP